MNAREAYVQRAEREAERTPAVHDGLAVASLILSIFWMFGFGSLLGVIFGHRSRGEAKRAGRRTSPMATAGVVIGYLGLSSIVFWVVVIAIGASTSGQS